MDAETNHQFAGRTLADIARTLPGATAVFRKQKLDFCCGGAVLLTDAVSAKGLSLAELEIALAAVAAATTTEPVPESLDTDALITLIENRFHAVHRRELPELVRLARRVEAVHKDKPTVPQGLAALLVRIEQELDAHMQKEEAILFPLMRRGDSPMIAGPISVMAAEHESHGLNLRALEKITNNCEPPEDACTTWRALYAGVRKFVDDVMEHIHLENNVLFPRFTA
jgi:regulator of cell morphogenesis and NO signaling